MGGKEKGHEEEQKATSEKKDPFPKLPPPTGTTATVVSLSVFASFRLRIDAVGTVCVCHIADCQGSSNLLFCRAKKGQCSQCRKEVWVLAERLGNLGAAFASRSKRDRSRPTHVSSVVQIHGAAGGVRGAAPSRTFREKGRRVLALGSCLPLLGCRIPTEWFWFLSLFSGVFPPGRVKRPSILDGHPKYRQPPVFLSPPSRFFATKHLPTF